MPAFVFGRKDSTSLEAITVAPGGQGVANVPDVSLLSPSREDTRLRLCQELLQLGGRWMGVLGVADAGFLHLRVIRALANTAGWTEPRALKPYAECRVLQPQTVGLHADERTPQSVERNIRHAVRRARPVRIG